ncbi:PEP-CTERM sorting domain-containing protein [Akkermansiaceae bacterium]|nr:PEP-CTERM sorting domain-containing protein [Akkermansiaceae bacterium]
MASHPHPASRNPQPASPPSPSSALDFPSRLTPVWYGFVSHDGFDLTISTSGSLDLNGLSIADAFETNLDAGAVHLWTVNTTGDTISAALTPVPEPSSAALLGLSAVALLFRRRRQARIK